MLRRGFAILLLVAIFMFSATYFVIAEETVWRMAHKMPPDSPEGKVFQLFADLVEEKSNGRLRIEVYPSEQLGGTEATIEMIREGTIQIYPEGINYLQIYVPDMRVINLPFLYRDREHWRAFVHSPLVEEWMKQLREEFNILLLGDPTAFLRGPYRVLVSTKPVLGLRDIKGLKLRMYPDETAVAVWEHLGAAVVMLEWTAIYEGFKRGVIEACTSPLALVESNGFSEVAKYIFVTHEFPQGMAFMTNYSQFKALPPDLQKALLEAHKEACEYSVELMTTAAEESVERMIRRDKVTFIRGPIDDFIKETRKLYEKWETEGRLPEGILDYIEGL